MTNVVDMFTAKVQPLLETAKTACENFNAQKAVFISPFEQSGITGPAFKKLYRAIRDYIKKRRTLRSILEAFPSVSRKRIQEFVQIVKDEKGLLDLKDTYIDAFLAVTRESTKWYDLYKDSATQKSEKDKLDKVYAQIQEQLICLDADSRVGLG